MTSDKLRTLQQIFRLVFELPAGMDVTLLSQKTQENWDSLGHVKLVAALESEFKVNIDTGDALRINSYETTRQLLEEKGA